MEIRNKSLAEQKKVLRDQRKAMLKEKKEKSEAEALLSAVKVCGISVYKELATCIVRQSEIVQSPMYSSGTIVTHVLVPAQFTPGL